MLDFKWLQQRRLTRTRGPCGPLQPELLSTSPFSNFVIARFLSASSPIELVPIHFHARSILIGFRRLLYASGQLELLRSAYKQSGVAQERRHDAVPVTSVNTCSYMCDLGVASSAHPSCQVNAVKANRYVS